MISRTGTIVFSSKCTSYCDGDEAFICDGIRQFPIGIICITYSSRKKKSKPFVFEQNVSVPECKFQLSSAVHGVILSSH